MSDAGRYVILRRRMPGHANGDRDDLAILPKNNAEWHGAARARLRGRCRAILRDALGLPPQYLPGAWRARQASPIHSEPNSLRSAYARESVV